MDGTFYKCTRLYSLLFLAILLKVIHRCNSDVEVALHLHHFMNPDSTLWDGSCCTLKNGQCDYCYYDFQVCISRQSSRHYTTSGDLQCDLGRWHSGMITPRSDAFYLPARFPSGHSNPLKIRVPHWEGRVRATIRVVDKGKWGYDNEKVIEYTLYLTNWNPARSEYESLDTPRHWILVRYGFRLDIRYAVYCLPDYYDRFCRTHCPTPTYYDHYTCDPVTGQKICHSGYSGTNCRQKDWQPPWWWWMTRRPVTQKRLTTTMTPMITSTATKPKPVTSTTTPTITTTHTPTTEATTTTEMPTTGVMTPMVISKGTTTREPTTTMATTAEAISSKRTTPAITATQMRTVKVTTPIITTMKTPTTEATTPTVTATETPITKVITPSVTTMETPTTVATTPTVTATETPTTTVLMPPATTMETPTTVATTPTVTTTETPSTKLITPTVTTTETPSTVATTPIVTAIEKSSTKATMLTVTTTDTPIVKTTETTTAASSSNGTIINPTLSAATQLLTSTTSQTLVTDPASSTVLESTESKGRTLTVARQTDASTDESYTTTQTTTETISQTLPQITEHTVDSSPQNIKSSSATYLQSVSTTPNTHVITKITGTQTEVTTSSDHAPSGATTTSAYTTDIFTEHSNVSTLTDGQTPASPDTSISTQKGGDRRVNNKTTNVGKTLEPDFTYVTSTITDSIESTQALTSSLSSTTKRNNMTDSQSTIPGVGTQMSTSGKTDSETADPTFPSATDPQRNPSLVTSPDGEVFTGVTLKTVLMTSNFTTSAEMLTTADLSSLKSASVTSEPYRSSRQDVTITDLRTVTEESMMSLTSENITIVTESTVTQHPSSSSLLSSPTSLFTSSRPRSPIDLRTMRYFPVRTTSSRICMKDVKRKCDCGRADMPTFPEFESFWLAALPTLKVENDKYPFDKLLA